MTQSREERIKEWIPKMDDILGDSITLKEIASKIVDALEEEYQRGKEDGKDVKNCKEHN